MHRNVFFRMQISSGMERLKQKTNHQSGLTRRQQQLRPPTAWIDPITAEQRHRTAHLAEQQQSFADDGSLTLQTPADTTSTETGHSINPTYTKYSYTLAHIVLATRHLVRLLLLLLFIAATATHKTGYRAQSYTLDVRATPILSQIEARWIHRTLTIKE